MLVFFAAFYLLFPVDAVPDLVPLLGWLDDIGVAALALLFLNRAWKQYRERSGLAGPAAGPAILGAARAGSTVVDTTGSDLSRD